MPDVMAAVDQLIWSKKFGDKFCYELEFNWSRILLQWPKAFARTFLRNCKAVSMGWYKVLLLWFQVINSVTSWNSIGVEYCHNGQKPLPAPFLEIAKQSPWVGTKVINSVTSWNSIGVEYCYNGQKPLPAPFLEIAKQSPWVGTKIVMMFCGDPLIPIIVTPLGSDPFSNFSTVVVL
ncbi:uncharacterized protein LOC113285608 isoform X3 [Papaver somniferum]|uniref:uncharacterized protein LOC113285608 isoform X3 n=1 Tax=Papaver somniferum TaxID=3469 RepID=UPI000E701F34|nr:uncharacterized protein LOC113285608 isoform X3 [Papaver somniferum]